MKARGWRFSGKTVLHRESKLTLPYMVRGSHKKEGFYPCPFSSIFGTNHYDVDTAKSKNHIILTISEEVSGIIARNHSHKFCEEEAGKQFEKHEYKS